MMTTAGFDTAARMTVLALKASLPKAARTGIPTWRLLGKDTSEVRSEDLVGILVATRKPVACLVAPSDPPGGPQSLRLTGTDDLDDYTGSRGSMIIDGIRRKYTVTESDDVISFRNRYTGASMLVSLEDLNTWLGTTISRRMR
jgi:hypothetical protein